MINSTMAEPSGFNSCKRVMFRKPFYYFIPSLVAIVRGIYFTHEDRVSVL